jgi:hypothetical protein
MPSTPIIPQRHIQFEFNKLLKASVSENTHKSHCAGMEAYYKACEPLHCQAWPLSLNSIVQFVLQSSRSGLAYSTVRSYLYVISYQCKLNQIRVLGI